MGLCNGTFDPPSLAECKQCPPTTYELRSCNLTTGADTFCASLPPSCVRQGQCAGLGLSNLPSGIVSGVTVLNVTNNRIFGVELRLLQALLASGVQKM